MAMAAWHSRSSLHRTTSLGTWWERQHVRDGILEVRQIKTRLMIPVHAALAASSYVCKEDSPFLIMFQSTGRRPQEHQRLCSGPA